MIVHASEELTMLFARIPPRFQSGIHNHTLFACIGQPEGEEVGTIFEPDETGTGIKPTGTLSCKKGKSSICQRTSCTTSKTREIATVCRYISMVVILALMDARSLWSASGHE